MATLETELKKLTASGRKNIPASEILALVKGFEDDYKAAMKRYRLSMKQRLAESAACGPLSDFARKGRASL